MQRFPVRMPDLDDNSPVRFGLWLVEPGDAVFSGDRLAEVLLVNGAATVEISSPKTGIFCDPLVWAGDPLSVDQILGYVEANITEDMEDF